jgi:hypothetical protein
MNKPIHFVSLNILKSPFSLIKLIFNQKYTLDTFNQRRSLRCNYRAITNSRITPNTAPAPNPWSLGCNPDKKYSSHQKRIIVPNTDCVLVIQFKLI